MAKQTRKDYLRESDYAPAYRSEYLSGLGTAGSAIWKCLAAMPCSYFDSPTASAPTLLALKQHAQSLCILLQSLTTSAVQAPFGTGDFTQDQAFDWLNDLTTPYQNDDAAHQLPITSLLNKIDQKSMKITRDVCPMHRHEVSDRDRQVSLPHATHTSLLEHANACLERLDHEFSATGGIMSILPVNRSTSSYARIMADSTLVGQMIAYTQGLVVRNRELEICLEDMRDLVSGNSFVPKELLSEIGLAGRQGTDIKVYPQDRFVITAVTNERWAWLSRELERQDVREGLQWIDVVTRYSRLRGHTAVFVSVGDLAQKREVEPAVVKVVMPTFPERATLWEQRTALEVDNARRQEREFGELQQKVDEQRKEILVLNQERTHLRTWKYHMENGATSKQAVFAKGFMMREAEVVRRETTLKERFEALNKREMVLMRKEREVEGILGNFAAVKEPIVIDSDDEKD